VLGGVKGAFALLTGCAALHPAFYEGGSCQAPHARGRLKHTAAGAVFHTRQDRGGDGADPDPTWAIGDRHHRIVRTCSSVSSLVASRRPGRADGLDTDCARAAWPLWRPPSYA